MVQLTKNFAGLIKNMKKLYFIIPDGFKVRYRKYMRTVDVKKSILFIGVKISFTQKCQTLVYDFSSMKRAVFVNLIHACDAYFITLLVRKSNFNFMPVHDCIIVLGSNVSAAEELMRDVFAEMYSSNLLASILRKTKAYSAEGAASYKYYLDKIISSQSRSCYLDFSDAFTSIHGLAPVIEATDLIFLVKINYFKELKLKFNGLYCNEYSGVDCFSYGGGDDKAVVLTALDPQHVLKVFTVHYNKYIVNGEKSFIFYLLFFVSKYGLCLDVDYAYDIIMKDISKLINILDDDMRYNKAALSKTRMKKVECIIKNIGLSKRKGVDGKYHYKGLKGGCFLNKAD